jgi:arginine/serine-rich splicing factor 4/5/6
MSRDKNSQIFIAKLSSSVRERDLEDEFKRYGHIKNTELKRGYAFIEYEDYRDADEAIKDMDGRKFEGNRIVVQHSRNYYIDRIKIFFLVIII